MNRRRDCTSGWPSWQGKARSKPNELCYPRQNANADAELKIRFGVPYETSLKPMFDLLGTPEAHKVLESVQDGPYPAQE